MIEIKNKIYNSKERKKQIRFNKYMTLKKTIRLKFKNLISLNENEKILYTDEYEFKDKIEKIDKGKYFAFNKRIHILSVIHKNEIDNFYYGFDSLVKMNPSKNSFSRIILDDRLKNSILSYKNKINSGGWINLGYISPKSSNLLNVVDYFHIFMFNLSDDYIGVSFVAKMDLIKSLVILLARGALISVVSILLVLPSLLIFCHKFIEKTTKNWPVSNMEAKGE